MIKIILTIIISFSFLSSLEAQWEIINEGLYGGINTMTFVNENVGWIGGWNGKLIKTIDGGENWSTISTSENWQIGAIKFINESIGWAIGSISDSVSYGILIKSTDGGINWVLQNQTRDNYFSSIHIVDENNVYAVGTKIYKTTNGGLNWIVVSPSLQNRNYNSVWFQDSQIGIVTGSYNDGTRDRAIILKTNNGGSSWNQTIFNGINTIYDLQFLNNTNGYFRAHNDSVTFLCKTENMFSEWIIKAQSSYGIASYQYCNNNSIYSVIVDSTYSNNIYKSTDDGMTWTLIKSFEPLGISINTIHFKNETDAFLSSYSNGSLLYRSTDAGLNWEIKKFVFPFRDACFINQSYGFLVGGYRFCKLACWERGSIFSTGDGGSTWDLKYSTNAYLRSFSKITNNILFAAGGCGIVKTIDGGNNWLKVYQSNFDSLHYFFDANDIGFADVLNGFVVGKYSDTISSGAGILLSSNSGETWDLGWKLPDSNNYMFNLNSIKFIDTIGWAVGESGLIIKYTPQTGWVRQFSVTDLPLNKIFFTDANNGWIAGGYQNENDFQSILLKTTNGGENWIIIPNLSYLIEKLLFIDKNIGWAIGYTLTHQGGILLTTDGGLNWVLNFGNLNSELNTLALKENFGLAVGVTGLIIRTTDAGLTWINDDRAFISVDYKLEQNYPNPFNPSTVINYQLPVSGVVTLKVYDVLGSEVANLVDEEKPAGSYEVEFKSTVSSHHLASGIYFYQLRAGDFVQTKKMVLVK